MQRYSVITTTYFKFFSKLGVGSSATRLFKDTLATHVNLETNCKYKNKTKTKVWLII